MRRTFIIMLGVGVTLGAMCLGGCVSASEHGRLQAANRQANRNLKTEREAGMARQAMIDDLRKAQQNQQAMLEAGAAEVKRTKAAYDELKTEFDRINALYEAELARDKGPMTGPLPAKVHAALRSLATANPDLMEYLPKYGMVKMKSDLSFPLGSAEVNPSASAALGKLAAILKAETARDLHVYIAGHTDDVPIRNARRQHPTNWYLSAHRAIGVQKVLTRAGLEPARIGVMGFGEYHPVAPNAAGNKGNAANRRVEIWIIPPGKFLTLPPLGAAG